MAALSAPCALLLTVGDPVTLLFFAGARDVGGGGGGPEGRRRSEHARGLLLLPDDAVVLVFVVAVVAPPLVLTQLTVGYLREAAAGFVGREGGALFAAKNGDDDTTEDIGWGTGFLAPPPSLLCLSVVGADAETGVAAEEELPLSSSKETEGDAEGLYLRRDGDDEDKDDEEEEPPALPLPWLKIFLNEWRNLEEPEECP